MVYIEKRKIGKNIYLYLCKKERVNGKVKRTLNIYLGKEENLKARLKNIKKTSTSISNLNTYNFGYIAALKKVSEILNLTEIINENTSKREQGVSLGDYLTLAIINRIDAPCSKNSISNWFENSYLSQTTRIKKESLSSQAYWNHLNYLNEHTMEKIEIALTKRVFDLLDVNLDCLLFDPTNFHTFIKTPKAGNLPKRGFAKSKRNDLKIVALSLLVTRDRGIPLMHKTYAGNTNDSKHFKSMIPEFISRFKHLNQQCKDITIVFDKGNNSVSNIDDLRDNDLDFVASLRPSTFKHLLEYPETKFSEIVLKNGKKILACKLQEKVFGINNQCLVITKDKKSEKRSFFKLNERLDYIAKELYELKAKLNVHVWKRRERVEEKITSILKRKAGKCINVKVNGIDGALSMEIEFLVDMMEKMVSGYGRSFLTTSRKDWTMEEVIFAYHDQYKVEHDFKEMKAVESIRTNPMYHWTDENIRAHLFICVLALLVKVFLREYLKKKKVNLSHSKIKEKLQKMDYVEFDLSTGEHITELSSLSKVPKKIRDILSLESMK